METQIQPGYVGSGDGSIGCGAFKREIIKDSGYTIKNQFE
jgi:hypothetical protein